MKRIKFRPYTFSLFDLFGSITIIGILLALILPALQRSRLPHRSNYCRNNTKQLLIALHNYHDVHKQFPRVTSTQLRGVPPGSVPSDFNPGAGYSWHIALLPYMEETALFNTIRTTSNDFTTPAFDPAISQDLLHPSRARKRYSAIVLTCERCPDKWQPEHATASEYRALGKDVVAGCNYVALSATHLDCILGDPQAPNYIPPNGVIVPGPQIIKFHDIIDGASKTLVITETREEAYSSWYDGTVAWVVGADPNGPSPVFNVHGSVVAAAGKTSINLGPSQNNYTCYLPAKLHGAIQQDWQWGPSSEHSQGKIVIHGVADGSVRSITDDIDPTLYLKLITRAGKEKAALPQ